MSLSELQTRDFKISFPRVSGDEPAGRIPILLAHPFSPRERG